MCLIWEGAEEIKVKSNKKTDLVFPSLSSVSGCGTSSQSEKSGPTQSDGVVVLDLGARGVPDLQHRRWNSAYEKFLINVEALRL